MLSLISLGHAWALLLVTIPLVGAALSILALTSALWVGNRAMAARTGMLAVTQIFLFWAAHGGVEAVAVGALAAPQTGRWIGLACLSLPVASLSYATYMAFARQATPIRRRDAWLAATVDVVTAGAAVAAMPWFEDPLTGIPQPGSARLATFSIVGAMVVLALVSGILMRYQVSRARAVPGVLTYKQAFDHFPGAFAVGGMAGRATAVNYWMRRLMQAHGLSVTASLESVWQHLLDEATAPSSAVDAALDGAGNGGTAHRCPPAPVQPGVSLQDVSADFAPGSQHVFVAVGKEVWKISRVVNPAAPRIMRLQLWGQDVSEQYILNQQLAVENQRIRQTTEALMQATDEAANLVEQQDVVGLRLRLHDILAQRLTFVRRFLDEGVCELPRTQALSTMLTSLTTDLWAAPDMGAFARLERLRSRCRLLGTELVAAGSLPADQQQAGTLIDVLAQATTNAMLHAGAEVVSVTFSTTPEAVTMTVSNDLAEPTAQVVEGSGLSGMRTRLAALDGTLEVVADDAFTLVARLPKAPPTS